MLLINGDACKYYNTYIYTTTFFFLALYIVAEMDLNYLTDQTYFLFFSSNGHKHIFILNSDNRINKTG